MIAKQIKGQSFGGLLRYMEEKVAKGVGERIDSNMLGITASELGKEFRLVSSLKPNLKKVVYHASLSLSKDDKAISNSTFIDIGKKYAEDMGFGQSQYIIYRHSDREHQHIHLIANRVSLNGEVVSDKWDYKRSEKSVRELEKAHGLIQVQSSNEVLEKSMSKAEVGLYKRKQVIPVRKQLQIIAKEALQRATNLNEFEQLIVKSGAELQLHKNQKGNLYGASFQLDGVVFKASSLGKGYSINQINKKLAENERNQRIGQTSGRGAHQDARSASRAYSKDEYHKHKTDAPGIIATNKRNQQALDDLKVGGTNINRATAESRHHQSESYQSSRRLSQENSRDETTQSRLQFQGLFNGNISGLNSQSGSMGNNTTDEIKKKHKKKRRPKQQGPRL